MKDKKDAKIAKSPDGVRIHYWVTWSPSMKKPFIVMHSGASMNHSSLQSLAEGLNERGHPTILFDQRGIGYSEAEPQRENYTLEKYSNDLQRIIEQEGLEKPNMLTHSFGFMVAIDYLSRTGNLGEITGICASHNFQKTINPFVLYAGEKIQGVAGYSLWLAIRTSRQLLGRETEYSEQNLAGCSDLRLMHALKNVPLKELRVQKANTGLGEWDISETLKKVSNPLHLIYGKSDILVRPYAGEEIAKLVKGICDVSVVNGTHSLPTTHPERVLEVMRTIK